MKKALNFNFSIGDENKNGKTDLSFKLDVLGFSVIHVVKDISISMAFDLFTTVRVFATDLFKKVGK